MLRFRALDRRGRMLLTFTDQVVSSLSNFATGVVVARLSGAAQFGEYALVLMIWLVVVGVQRRVIAEPLIVATRDRDAHKAPIAQGMSAEVLFGLLASTIVAMGGLAALGAGAKIGVTMLALATWLVPLLVQDYWRAIAFQRRRPDLALANDVVFAFVQAVVILGFAIVGWRGAGAMITAWGAGGLAGALLGFSWFPSLSPLHEGLRLLRRLWPLGRWLLADFATAFASQQAYIAFAALLLSKDAYGGFRAATSLLGPVMVIAQAFGNFGLPEAARRAAANDPRALDQYARRLSMASIACVAVYALFLVAAARHVLTALYGAPFSRYALIAVLAGLQYVVIVTASGQGIALRVTGEIRRIWRPRILTAGLSLGSLAVLVKMLGAEGAGWAGLATGAFDSLAIHYVYHRARTRPGGEAAVAGSVLGSGPLLLPDTGQPPGGMSM